MEEDRGARIFVPFSFLPRGVSWSNCIPSMATISPCSVVPSVALPKPLGSVTFSLCYHNLGDNGFPLISVLTVMWLDFIFIITYVTYLCTKFLLLHICDVVSLLLVRLRLIKEFLLFQLSWGLILKEVAGH